MALRPHNSLSSRTRWSLATAAAVACVLMLTSSAAPAAAYLLATGGFADGSDSSTLNFGPLDTDLEGPSLRLLTNSTVTSGSLVASGALGYSNATIMETSTTEFASATLRDDLDVSGGRIVLQRGSEVLTLNASNAFGGAALSGLVSPAGLLVLNGTTSGTFVSANLTAPAGGWGVLSAAVNDSSGGSVTFALLTPGGGVIVSNQAAGAVIDVDPISYPVLRVRGTFSAPNTSVTPALEFVTVGERVTDALYGSGTSRTMSGGAVATGPGITITPDRQNMTKYSGNPVLRTKTGTYYSAIIGGADVIQVAGQFWMYFTGQSCSSCAGQIGRAVSNDGTNWTFDSSPLISGTASTWDSSGVGSPDVIENPNGTGYLMYFSGGSGGFGYIGMASSPDGVNWTEYSGNPVLSPTSSAWDSQHVAAPTVLYDNGSWTMYYHGTTSSINFQFGLATSTDGVNWTKFSGNPVITRGPSGSLDVLQVWQGDIIRYHGELLLYYSCGGPSQFKVCLANSTNGYNWTKQGLVLQSAGGWEGSHVHDPTATVVNDHIILYYLGENGVWQMGRADADWHAGSYVSHMDFGNRRAASLLSLHADTDVPTGASAKLYVRSSVDNSAWSTWENVGSSGTIANTPGRQFVEWRVDLDAAPGSDAPSFYSAWLDYDTYLPSATYISSLFTFPEQVSAVSLVVEPAQPNGTTLTMAVSNDNGSTWVSVTQGNVSDLVTAGGSFLYRLQFEGTTYTSPIVDSVALALQLRGYPSNVSVRLGIGGTPFASVSGPVSGSVNLTLPVDELNSIINSTRIAFPGATFVDVPLFVSSSHFGVVRLAQPRLTIELKNPLNATFDPPGPVVGFYENNTTTFGTNYTVFPSWVKVNITWKLDGTEIAGHRDQLQYNFTADYASAGNYTLEVTVENGDFSFNHTWAIEVYNLNRPPVFTFMAPATPYSMSHAAFANFTAQAMDPDGEALTWAWDLDGFGLSPTSASVTVGGLSPGVHGLHVLIADPWTAIEFTWTITSTNAVPRILSRSPGADFNMSHTASQVVSVGAVDGDGEALAYRWVLDGVAVANASGNQLTVQDLSVGVHTLSLTVRDPYSADTTAWIIFSTNALPVVSTAFPAADVSVSHRAGQDFVVAFTDTDGDPLFVQWFVDGVEVANGSSSFRLEPVGMGLHVVYALAGDGYGTAARFWNVTGTNAAPVVTALEPGANLTVSVIDSANLSVTVEDPDGDPVNYTWWFGVVPLGSFGSSATVGPLEPGNWEVSARLSDGLSTALAVFHLHVLNFGPEVTDASPSGDFRLPHNQTTTVSVTAVDYEGDPLTYAWTLDSRVLTSTGPEVTIGPLTVGNYVLRVVIRDVETPVEVYWNVTVVNDPPTFLNVTPPAGDVSVKALEDLTLSVRAVDTDGDPVALQWSVDNAPAGGGPNVTLMWPVRGSHVVTVDATSYGAVTTLVWNVTVVQDNTAPVVTRAAPNAAEVAVHVGEEGVFAVEYDDDGVLPVTLTWLLDGVEVGSGSGFTYRPEGSDVGSHQLTVRVSDGEYAPEHSWTVLVSQAPETTQGGLGDTVFLFVGLAVGAGAMAVVLVLLRRRGPAGGP